MVGTASDGKGESEFVVEFVRQGDVAWCELVSRSRIRDEFKIRSQASSLLDLGWFDPWGWGYVRSWLRGAQLSRWYRTVGLEGSEVSLEDLNRAILETFLNVHGSPPVGVASAESEEPRRPPGPAPEFYSPR
jgi:hypothetical protein